MSTSTTTSSRASFLLSLSLLLLVIISLDAFLLPPPPPRSRLLPSSSSSSSPRRSPLVFDQARGGGGISSISSTSTRRSRRITILTQQDQQQQQEQEKQPPPPQQTIHSVGGIHVGLDNVTSTTINTASSKPSSSTTSTKPPSEDIPARIHRLESTILTLEKQIKRLEVTIAGGNTRTVALKKPKTVVINYDVGPDASIDSIDIALGAAASFGLLGLCVGRSLAKNLWLVGFLVSAVTAGCLAREEEGGALSDVIRAVGFEIASKTRQFLFMYRTGRLSYVYFKKWEEIDRKYAVLRKVEAVKAFSLKKWREAEEAEKKYEMKYRLTSFLKATYNGAIDGVASLSNAKDRKELVKKMPKPLRYLFMSKAQRKAEESRRRVTVRRFVGLRNGRPVVEVEDD